MSTNSLPDSYRQLPVEVQQVLRSAEMLDGIGFLFPEDDKQEVRVLSFALSCGLLAEASITIIDSLFDDVCRLQDVRSDDPDLREIIAEDTAVLRWLPERFAHRYDSHFARQFLVATVDLVAAISNSWRNCPTVAHELALHVLLDQTEVLSESLQEVTQYLEAGWRGTLEDCLFEDLDFRLLYDPGMDGIEDNPEPEMGMAPLRFESWFQPFNPSRHPVPFARHDT
ncbi:hypothetical protein [Corynebacterium spheniscorum]|uniref:Uncharacterized protein n=1 Tax=Corynebacterium spheniscorum TaxID=185761 RepID=A0A1I2V6Y6_9CORY|nr:hypothetical protein [Corynebacterium spheniscorum]KAA8719183.1 hypothetical protein F4V56_10620 [Corynebacterium spheniscorum]SFG85148.1 hypothetical protein SAMN05660282_02148 [Corynebacterium spheniscorum]